MAYGEIYFWTATMLHWKTAFMQDEAKDICVKALDWLISRERIDLFAYIIMPNHVHFIWRMREGNGSEMPHVSFLKFTGHELRKYMATHEPDMLKRFRVSELGRSHRFWQRDSLAVRLWHPRVAFQKMDYLHNNPVGKKWKLVMHPADYKYSSAAFYVRGEKGPLVITDLRCAF